MASRPKPSPTEQPIIVIRRVKKVVGGGHHGGAWKVAYADFVTAMMAFFMLLWLLSNPDKQQLKGLAEYFSPSTASSSPGEAIETAASSKPGLAGQQQRAQASKPQPGDKAQTEASTAASRAAKATVPDASMRVMAEELKLLLQATAVPRAQQQEIQLQNSREGLRVSLMDDDARSMFHPGTATLSPYARVLLQQIARKFATGTFQLAIEGHTDGQGGQSGSNWQLSADRALAARAALIEGGLAPNRFSEVVALAGSQPVYPDQPLRPENRRITIVLLAESNPLPNDVSFRF